MSATPDMADIICLLLFAVPPSDRALTGWGLGATPFNNLQGIGGPPQPGDDKLT